MYHSMKQKPGVMLAVGLVVGMIAGMMLPHSPAHAVATDRHENFAICTISVTDGMEAVCILDSVTGDLKAYVLSPQTATFALGYYRNLVADFNLAAGTANPKFLMVSGQARLIPRGANMPRGMNSALYIAELTSGQIHAYGLAFSPNMRSGQANPVLAMDKVLFRQKIVRPGGAVGGGVEKIKKN